MGKTEDSINFKKLFQKHWRKWPWLLISIFLSIYLSKTYCKYADKLYKVTAKVIIRDKRDKKLGAENLIHSLEIFSKSKNIETEIGVIKSYSSVYNSISKLPFGISYYVSGDIKTSELYENKVFEILIDSSHNQIINTNFEIQKNVKGTIDLSISGENIKYGNLSTDKREKIKNCNFEIKNIEFNTWIEDQYFKFKIIKKKELKIETPYMFKINELESLARKYLGKLNVKQQGEKSSIILLSITGLTPAKEIDFLNQLIYDYINRNLEEKNNVAKNTLNFINNQLTIVTSKLHLAEKELENYQTGNNVIDFSLTSELAHKKLEQLDQEKAELLVQDQYFNYLLEYVLNKNDNENLISPSVINVKDPLLNKLLLDLNELYSKRKELQFGANKQNPILDIVENKINITRQSLSENLKNLQNSSRIKLKDVEERYNKTLGLVQNLPKTERGLVNIKRRFNLNNHIYNYLLEKQAEVGIAKAGYTPDNSILEIARLNPISAVRPKEKLIVLGGFLIGLILPMGLIFMFDLLNKKMNSSAIIKEELNIPFLGFIAHNKSKSETPIIEGSKLQVSESIRSVRVNLQYLLKNQKCNILTLTSTTSGEGKTFCALNIAISLALSNKKVLVIGGDMRKPRLGINLNLKKSKGLTDYLIGKAHYNEIIDNGITNNLDVIVAGPIPPNPTELLESEAFDQLIKKARSAYDFVVIDSSPIGLVPDFMVLNKYSDLNIFVFRHNYSRNSYVNYIKELSESEGINRFCCLYNDFQGDSTYEMNYGYGYGYGYGYDGNLYSKKSTKKGINLNKVLN